MDSAEVRAHEHKAWIALCDSGSALLPLLSKDCVMLFPGGMMLTEQSTPTLKSTLTSDSFTPWKKYTIFEDEVRQLDAAGSAALTTYKVTAEREIEGERSGDEAQVVVFKALCSSAWRRRVEAEKLGEWEMVSHQQTPI